MIDFNNASFVKLSQVGNDAYQGMIAEMLLPDEQLIATFKGMRDGVVFTTKRLIAINVQGITGKKVDFSSLPYHRIQAFSVETAGVLDLDSELELWFSGLGKVKLEFTHGCNVQQLAAVIGRYTL